MATPYIEELALVSKNNEAISEIIYLKETVEIDGVKITRPVDLTGRSFFAQARTSKSPDADLICDIVAVAYEDPTMGMLHLSVSDEVMLDVLPVRGHYDVLTKVGPGTTDNIYMAPFVVEGGVSKWLP